MKNDQVWFPYWLTLNVIPQLVDSCIFVNLLIFEEFGFVCLLEIRCLRIFLKLQKCLKSVRGNCTGWEAGLENGKDKHRMVKILTYPCCCCQAPCFHWDDVPVLRWENINALCQTQHIENSWNNQGLKKKEVFYLTTHSTHLVTVIYQSWSWMK